MSLNIFIACGGPTFESYVGITSAESVKEAQEQLDQLGSNDEVTELISSKGPEADALYVLMRANEKLKGEVEKLLSEIFSVGVSRGMRAGR